MSEKRFKLSEIYNNQIIDTGNCINNGTHCRLYDLKECVDLLNELSEENEQLREELNNLKKDETMLYHYYTLARYGGDGV